MAEVNNTPLINGEAYDFASVVCNILGVPVMSISAINYATKQEKVNNYGAGKYPVSRGRGVKEYEASLDIAMEDIEKLREVAPNGDLTDIPPFDITVSFLKEGANTTHVLKACEFTEDGVDASQGDTEIKKGFPLMPGSIKYN